MQMLKLTAYKPESDSVDGIVYIAAMKIVGFERVKDLSSPDGAEYTNLVALEISVKVNETPANILAMIDPEHLLRG